MTVCVAAGSSEATIADIVRLYSATLKDRGYRVPVVPAYTRAVEHLLDWAGTRTDWRRIDESLIRNFVKEHLPVCECAGRRQRGKTTVGPALKHLAEILGSQGMLTPEDPREPEHIRHELDAFCAYATKVCGLAQSTLISRRMWVDRFLQYHFPASDIVPSKLGTKDIGNFFIAQRQGYQPGSAQVVASAVCGFERCRMKIR